MIFRSKKTETLTIASDKLVLGNNLIDSGPRLQEHSA